MMDDICSLCGSNNDVRPSGDVYMCVSCRDTRPIDDARLKFAKWAVEHGKISDFPGRVDELYEQTHKTEPQP